MPYEQGRDAYPSRGHSRSRSSKGSADLSRPRSDGKPPSQKAMLSRALQKANTAVQLDNAQNLEGARLAYAEACDLLQKVLTRTTGDENKRKLETIKSTYVSRIEELDQMGPWDSDSNKALPSRPDSSEYQSFSRNDEDSADYVIAIGTASSTNYEDESFSPLFRQLDSSRQQRHVRNGSQGSPRPGSASQRAPPPASFSRSPARRRPSEDMPPPLPMLRPLSPAKPQANGAGGAAPPQRPATAGSWTESKEATAGQNSWLDPIDESGGSTGSSLHSRTSSLAFRRRYIRAASDNTEHEFDTALDAAIEAAYDDGYEPAGPNRFASDDAGEELVSRVLRKVEMARERVRQTEREALDNETQRRRQLSLPDVTGGFYDDGSSEDEERMLEEMTRCYGIEDFTMKQQRRPSVSRPESRGLTPSTRQGSVEPSSATETQQPSAASDRTPPRAAASKALKPSGPPPAPPPTHSLPELPGRRPSSSQSVRNRRLSGQNPKQLKIETTERRLPSQGPLGPLSTSALPAVDRGTDASAGDSVRSAAALRHRDSPPTAATEPRPHESPVNGRARPEGDEMPKRRSESPGNWLRRKASSSSFRSAKGRNVWLSNVDDGSDMSPSTPSSNNQVGTARTPAVPTLPTPMVAVFRDNADGPSTGGLHLFEDGFHLASSSEVPNPLSLDAPVPLEPCPNDFLLRPFWLMRCLYQTLAHPRGGYLSTKLFVPKDAWKVKGVKLKNVEDKISNCDLLTAALLKLARVDNCDADAVLDEMQALEGMLEQVQATLSRRLGSEVGVQSSGVLFKEASNVEGDGGSAAPRATSVSSKSSFSWRRLRSKNSGIGLAGSFNGKTGPADGAKDLLTLPTLPMTPQPTSRPAKRDIGQAQFLGPNANYMSSLARLFDAAQVIDQIARQVDDPGLRHADKTQVGLELCTRHAAEFFGFYVCRFVLTDLGMLLDKFIKRGSEWVMS